MGSTKQRAPTGRNGAKQPDPPSTRADDDEPTVFFTVYESLYDNRVLDEYRFDDVPWSDFTQLLATEHQVAERKDASKLLAPVRFLQTDDEACQLAEFTAEDAERGRGRAGEPKRDGNGRPCAWRGALNVDAWSMLPVDIDGQQSLEEALQFFGAYDHVGYTSFNHLADGKTEKFRLFLLLQQPTSHADLKARLPAVRRWLGDVDHSSVASARGFYLPSCPEARLSVARRWVNTGSQRLDISSFPEESPPSPRRPTSSKCAKRTTLPGHERAALLDLLHVTYLGNYEDWWKLSSAMVAADYTLEDFVYVTVGGAMREKSASDCEKQWRKAQARHQRGASVSPGFLVNLVGGSRALGAVALRREIAELEELLGETK
jgi:hypothetical protein